MKSWFHGLRRPPPAPETSMHRRRRSFHVETVPYTNRAHYVVSPQWVITTRALCESAFADYKKQRASAILDGDHPDSVRVRRISSEIVRAVPRGLAIRKSRPPPDWLSELDWEVIVARDDSITAITWPSAGKIVVSTNFLQVFYTDAEIAMVLAHEVGHIIARHDAELMSIASFRLKLPFLLRRSEVEADRIGILLLAAAGYDPRLGLQVWHKFARMVKGSTLHNFLSCFQEHPSSKKRWKLLSRPKVMEEALELYRKVSAGPRP